MVFRYNNCRHSNWLFESGVSSQSERYLSSIATIMCRIDLVTEETKLRMFWTKVAKSAAIFQHLHY